MGWVCGQNGADVPSRAQGFGKGEQGFRLGIQGLGSRVQGFKIGLMLMRDGRKVMKIGPMLQVGHKVCNKRHMPHSREAQ